MKFTVSLSPPLSVCRSGNSEVSDVQLESPVKELRPVTPEGPPPAVTFEQGLSDKTPPCHKLFTMNAVHENSTAGKWRRS